MKVLVTGGGGFIGSHVCEYYARRHHQVIALDNLSRFKLLKKSSANALYNWNHLSKLGVIRRVRMNIGDFSALRKIMSGVNLVVHTAAQTAVTMSVLDPLTDFKSNAIGTLNLLEAARQQKKPPVVVVCSTNKVYGENVNQVRIRELKTRYVFQKAYRLGIAEDFGVDLCEHTPYGCSKLSADLYAQDYARLYGVKTGVFRMSCIYGTRQFGVEDQGWIAWFVIAAVTKKPVTIFGDGKQVRDVLWVDDLIRAFDAFYGSHEKHTVLNMGGGVRNTLSLLELVSFLKERGFSLKTRFAPWRSSDQKVYISNIRKAKRVLAWEPQTSPGEGVSRLVEWCVQNKNLFL